MSLHNKQIYHLILSLALVISTSAHAGLYGFSRISTLSEPEHLDIPPRYILNYRKDMRNLIISLSDYGRSRIPGFQVIPHEGQYLLNKSLWEYHLDGYNKIRQSDKLIEDKSFLLPENQEDTEILPFDTDKYISAINGIVINNRYCKNTPIDSNLQASQLPIFSIEQCSDDDKLDEAIAKSLEDKSAIYPFLDINKAFRKAYHQLIVNENANNISKASEAKNITFLINDEQFEDRYRLLDEVNNSNYDIVIINPMFHGTTPFSAEDINTMKYKKNGARRLIIALYNISEIQDSDGRWQKKWRNKFPNWIAAPSLINANSYITKYWRPEWKKIASRSFKNIVDSGYDGVFLTGLENHRYFEKNRPLE